MNVTLTLLVNGPVIASALATSTAIAGMFVLRCAYPPSDVVALTAMTGGPAAHALGYRFVLEPILIRSALLLVGALVYHTATGRRYPHAQCLPAAEHPPTAAGFTRAGIVAALRHQGELLDVDPEGIEAMLCGVQLQAYTRTLQALTYADTVTTPVVTVLAGTSIPRALKLLRRHGFKALLIVDEGRRVVGVITRVDLLDPALAGMRQTLRRWFSIGALTPPRVVDHMGTRVQTIAANTPMSDLVPIFTSADHHHILVLDADGRLAGIITESDLVGGLYRQANIEPQAT